MLSFQRSCSWIILFCLLSVFAPAVVPAAEPAVAEDIADVPVLDLRAAKNENMRYFLIGGGEEQERPRKGFKLLLVLSGGDGSADFRSFVCRLWKKGLGEDYLVAQLVAPKWSDDQFEKLVWPTKQRPWPKMKFTTEDFVINVIADVARRQKLDPSCVLALGWSSGGPAVYACCLDRRIPIAGGFVAMSVFKPKQLPALEAARGKAFYLLHGTKDRIPMIFPEEAKTRLVAARAQVELVKYEGPHGWPPDVYERVRTGVRWLEEHRAAARRRR